MSSDRVYVIAEAGVNHNGQKDLAFALVDVAANAGADAVKFQTFDANRLASENAPKALYQKNNTEASESQREMLKKLELPHSWHFELKKYANMKGIDFLSTAFDLESLDFLSKLDIPFFKVPSGELTNTPVIWAFARTKKPLVISTGMATLSEIELALATIAYALSHDYEPDSLDDIWRNWSNRENPNSLQTHVKLLHCTSQYPTPYEEVNLRAMDTLYSAFGLDVGYSDHTEGLLVPIAAVARGAKIIEKHFTLDKGLAGPDHKASIEPAELQRLIRDIRALEVALGDGRKVPQPSEWDTRKAARQKLVAAREIPLGKAFERIDLTTARCEEGLSPNLVWDLIGQTASKKFFKGEAIK